MNGYTCKVYNVVAAAVNGDKMTAVAAVVLQPDKSLPPPSYSSRAFGAFSPSDPDHHPGIEREDLRLHIQGRGAKGTNAMLRDLLESQLYHARNATTA